MLRQGLAPVTAEALDQSFEAWRQGVERDLARQLRVEARSRLEQSARLQDWDRVRDAAEALHFLDPTDASVAAQLIEALGRLGHADRAERALAEFLEARGDQGANGIVEDAITRVRALRLGTEAPSDLEMPLVPLLGRSQALGVGKAAFQRALDGAFPVVLITGESGIGKTRVLRELMGTAEMDGFRCLGVRSTEPEQRLPLNSLLDGLEGVELGTHLANLGPPWSAVLSSVLPSGWAGNHPWPPPQVSDGVRVRRLFVALTLLFEQLAREQPTILFIDDLQWADETTVTALHFMRRRWKTGAFGVIAAQTTNPGDKRSGASLSMYWDRSATSVHLTELSASDSLRLVMHILGQGVDPQVARRVCALAGPHPLFLTELARDVRATGSHVAGPAIDEIRIPTSLKQLLESRLAPLSCQARTMAGVLAVAARPLGLEVLARACGEDLHDALHAADELQRTRLVEWKADRASIAHDLFRQALYDELGQPRRAMIHRTLAAELHSSDGDSAAAEVAHHYASAGEQTLASAFGRLAADNAMRTGAVEEAAHLFRLVADNERGLERKADATAACARALFLARDIAAAEPFFDLGIERLRQVGRVVDAARLEIRFVEGLAELGGTPIAALVDRLAQVRTDAEERLDWETVALALDGEMQLLHRLGDIHGIRRVLAEMRRVSASGNVGAQIVAQCGLALGVLFGDPGDALRAARRAVDLAAEGRSYRLKALLRLMVALQCRGFVEGPDFRKVLDEVRAAAAKSGDVLLHFSVENNAAVAALDAGDLPRAEALLARTYDLANDAEMDLNRLIQANNAAELAMAQEDWAGATACFTRALSYAGSSTPDYLRQLASAGLGLCALNRGNLSDARRRIERLPRDPEAWYYDPCVLLTFRARFYQRMGEVDRAIELLDSEAAGLDDRLVLAGLKIRSLQVRLLAGLDRDKASAIAEDCLARALSLGLRCRVKEFQCYLDRYRS